LETECPLLAQSRHPDRVGECPLSGVKRTSKFKSVTSAFDPYETCRVITCGDINAVIVSLCRVPLLERAFCLPN
jgi:hypothetical protein